MYESPSSQSDIEQRGSDAETGELCPTSVEESEGAIEVPESHAYDDFDMLAETTDGHMPWCPFTPFVNLLAYMFEQTIYRNVKRKKFGDMEDLGEQ